jgi:hypothetical protein
VDAVARNLFSIDYCRDHPNTTKVEFKNAWKLVEANKEKKAVSPMLIVIDTFGIANCTTQFYVTLSWHNKVNSLKPDMNGSGSSTLT